MPADASRPAPVRPGDAAATSGGTAQVPDTGTDKSSGNQQNPRGPRGLDHYLYSSGTSTPTEGFTGMEDRDKRPVSPAVLKFIEQAGPSSGSGGVSTPDGGISGGGKPSGGSADHSGSSGAAGASNGGDTRDKGSPTPTDSAATVPGGTPTAFDSTASQPAPAGASLILGAAIPASDSGAETPPTAQPTDSGTVESGGTSNADAVAPTEDKSDGSRAAESTLYSVRVADIGGATSDGNTVQVSQDGHTYFVGISRASDNGVTTVTFGTGNQSENATVRLPDSMAGDTKITIRASSASRKLAEIEVAADHPIIDATSSTAFDVKLSTPFGPPTPEARGSATTSGTTHAEAGGTRRTETLQVAGKNTDLAHARDAKLDAAPAPPAPPPGPTAQSLADPPKTSRDRLPAAANAWHGVDVADAVSARLPHTDGTPLGHDVHTPDGSYVLKPQVVHTSEGDRVVYYNAWNPHTRRVELVVGPRDLDAFLKGDGASGSPTAPNRQPRGRGVPAADHGTARLDAPEKLLTTARAELRAMRERAEAAHPRASQKQKATWTFSVCKVVTPDGKVTASSEGAFYGGKARHAEQVALGKLDRSAIRPQDTVIVFTEQFACQERCVPYIERWQKSVNGGLRVYSEAARVTQTHPDGTKEDVASGAKSTALKAGSRSEIIEDLSLRKSAVQPNNQDFHAPRHSPVGWRKPETPRSVPPTPEIAYPTRETTRSSAIEGLGMWLNQTQAKLSGEHEQVKLDAAVKALRPQIDGARRAGKYVVLNVTVDQPRVEDLGSSIFTTPDQLRYLVGVTMTTGDTREEALNPPLAWEPGRPRDQQTGPVRVPPGRTDPRKWVTYPIVMEPIAR